MLDRLARILFRRLGRRYRGLFLATQIPASVLVAVGVLGVLAAFYHPSLEDAAVIVLATSGFTTLGVGAAIARQRRPLAELAEWAQSGARSGPEAIAAWNAAANFPVRSFRRDSLATNAIAALPSVAVIVIVLGLPLSAYPVLLAAGAIAAAYGTIVTYSIAEFFLRPLLESVDPDLPENARFSFSGLPLHRRLVLTLPVFTAMTGLVVAAIVRRGGGTRELAITVAASLLVGLILSLELTMLLSRAITSPVAKLRDAFARVREGAYEVRVPVVSSDELGELSDAFNRMARGLAEREQLREAFGTYLDKDVAGFILSGRFPEEGVEIDVSIMFCDVPGFTSFAERSSASEVVSALNAMFELLVPIIVRHGGHVDKFIGDGLLAVFGAPEGFSDHADRALAAGLEILDAFKRDSGPLRVSVGINSGRVVAGSIGGAGRLNFSVIGDAVNVAARVEAATRNGPDDLLLTRATADARVRTDVPLSSRGRIPLKGKSDPVELLAPEPQPAGAPLLTGGGTPREPRDPPVRPLP